MKNYSSPQIEKIILLATDVITTSADPAGIVDSGWGDAISKIKELQSSQQ